jgi:hypothetical protein
MGLFDGKPELVFQFESGDRCATCGLYHADQWQCDASIPNPWGSDDEDGVESREDNGGVHACPTCGEYVLWGGADCPKCQWEE